MTDLSVPDLLERISSLLRADTRLRGNPQGLNPVQVEALLYLDRCNRYSDSPLAVADFLGLTKGTVSQTLNVLERNGLIEKRADPDDGRRVRLRLTRRGSAVARKLSASPVLDQALAHRKLDSDRLQANLRALLAGMQRVSDRRSFGVCHTCRYFERDGDAFRCGLTQERLSTNDAQLICREHDRTAAG